MYNWSDLELMYVENEEFREYVKNSMRVNYRHLSLQEFLKLAHVREVAMYYIDSRKGVVTNSTHANIGECQ